MQQIATFLVILFIIGAYWQDSKQKHGVSAVLWVPSFWLMILASRPLSVWFAAPTVSMRTMEDGSSFDRNILTILIFFALFVLLKRNVRWFQWIGANPWLVALFLFSGLSILWSDFAMVALKRWLRGVGSIWMVLLILTETDPVAAVRTIIRRNAFILIPVSVLFIKYYRYLGVGYNFWTGGEFWVGATVGKNQLGLLCLISSLFLIYDLLEAHKTGDLRKNKLYTLFLTTTLVTALWLLVKSNSSTALASFTAGAAALLATGIPFVRKNVRAMGIWILSLAGFVWVLNFLFGLVEYVVVDLLGRDMTLTDRTNVWAGILAEGTNPLIGVGYDSFWLGDRLVRIAKTLKVGEAHNGYLEVYIELGIIGLLLFIGLLFGAFGQAKRSLLQGDEFGRLQLGMLVVFIFYNITEAAYKVTHYAVFVFLLVCLKFPTKSRQGLPVEHGPPRDQGRPLALNRGKSRVTPGHSIP